MPYIIVTVCILFSGLFCVYFSAKENTERVEKANNTSYEITINNKDTYFCEDYKSPNKDHSVEGERLPEYRNNYVFIYKDGVETVLSDSVNSFKVKEIKTNVEDNASS